MKDLVGIDIKHDYIKVVQLKKLKHQLKLHRAAVVPTPTDLISNSFIIDTDKLSFILTKVFKDYGIRCENAAISISDRTIMTQIAKYPDMPKEEMISVIRGEAEQYSHFAGKEIIVDIYNINDVVEGNTKKINVLWVAILNDVISNISKALYSTIIIRSFNTAGFIKFLFCEPTSLAFLRSVRRNITISSNKTSNVVVCIVINDTTTDMLALQGTDNLIFIRSLYVGRNDFEKVIKPAEDLLLLNPVPTPLSNLVVELQRSLSFIAKQIPVEVNISGAYVGGSIQYLNKISEFLTRELKITVEIHNPLTHIYVDKEFFSSVFLEQFGISLAPAIGLALREDIDNKININLVPSKEPATIALEKIKNIALPLCIFIISVFLCVNVWLTINISHVKRKISMSKKENRILLTQVNKLEGTEKEKLKVEEKIKSLEEFKKISSSHLNWLELIKTISKLSSNSVWLTKLDVSDTKVVTISGLSLSHVSISDFISELNKSVYFRDFNLIENLNTSISENPAVKFTISGYLK